MDENDSKVDDLSETNNFHDEVPQIPPKPKAFYSVGHGGDDIKFVSSNLLNSERENEETFTQGVPCSVMYDDNTKDITAMSVLSLYRKEHDKVHNEMNTDP